MDAINLHPKTTSHQSIQIKNTTLIPSIGFKNLNYEIVEFGKSGLKPKLLLENLNGHFDFHSLNGLLGPSGAGKTTLLNYLSGNYGNSQSEKSKIYLNNQASLNSFFIEQHVHENIEGTMTVQEIFKFAFKFKNGPYNKQHEEASKWIAQIMDELMLPDELLERQFCKCSGGQQKRIAIAQELMSLEMPSFLFVDEPTTGLDSVAALEVISCLKNLAARHRITVIASIHAPNSEILDLFDKIYVLAKGGVAIYSDDPKYIKPYLEREIQINISAQEPPIEALIRIACKGTKDETVSLLGEKCSEEQQKQLSVAIAQNNQNFLFQSHGLSNTRKRFQIYDLFIEIYRQFLLSFVHNYRQFLSINVSIIVLFWFISTFFSAEMALPSGCISLKENLQENSSNNCQEEIKHNSLMRENVTFLWYIFLFSGQLTICISAIFIAPFIKVFASEHRNNWYSFGVFYLSNSIINLLQATCYAVVMVLSSYFMTNQHSIDNYGLNFHRLTLYFFIIWLYSAFMQAIGQLVGILFLNYVEVAITLSVIVNSTMVFFNQLFYDMDKSGSHFLIAISDLIGVKYLIKTLIYTFYGFGRCESEKEMSIYMSIYDVNEAQILKYLLRMTINVLAIRLLTWAVMLFKLSAFKNMPLKILFSKRFTTFINFKFLRHKAENKNIKKQTQQQEHAIETENDFKYDEFLRNKIIIGFRKLSLYTAAPFYVNFNAQFNDSKKSKLILNELNGQFRFGTLNGLMGASGSGKTTLLKVLNGQCKSRLSPESQFYLSRYTKIATCFIQQEVSAHLMSGLTVKQLLMYASRLKNQSKSINHTQNVLSWLAELELSDIANVQVDKCSGGERKRLALALELTALQLPNLICIDEPTSGLDSNSALIVISCIRRLTLKHNITIITSIHQPNAEILQLFDQLYVLALGGVCIYSGPPNKIESTFLEQISESTTQGQQLVDSSTTTTTIFPIELLLKYSSGRFQNFKIQSLIEQNNLQLTKDDLKTDTRLAFDGVAQNRVRFSLLSVKTLLLRYITYLIRYYWQELAFFYLIYAFFTFTLTHIFSPEIALPSGCISVEDDFNNTCTRTQENVQQFEVLMDNFKYTFMMGSIFQLLHIFQIALSFQKDLTHFWNEHQNGWYSTGAFYLMKRVGEILSIIPIILLHLHLCNYYETIRPGIYWHFVSVLLLAIIAIQCFAHLFVLWSSGNVTFFMIIVTLAVAFSIMLSNIFIYIHNLNYVYRFAANFSILRFTFEGFILLQYGFGRCGPRQIQPLLFMMQLEDADYYTCLGMLLLNSFVFQICAIWLLISKTNNNSQSNRGRVNEEDSKQPNSMLKPVQNDFVF